MDDDKDNNSQESIETDSISWGTAAKSSGKKIYGNALIAPHDMAKKIINMKLLEQLALGEIDAADVKFEK